MFFKNNFKKTKTSKRKIESSDFKKTFFSVNYRYLTIFKKCVFRFLTQIKNKILVQICFKEYYNSQTY